MSYKDHVSALYPDGNKVTFYEVNATEQALGINLSNLALGLNQGSVIEREDFVIPEENTRVVLYNSKPTDELFIGGVTVTKTTTGYKLNGFDQETFQFLCAQSPGSFHEIVSQCLPYSKH